MLTFIGGAARTGKGLFAQRLLVATHRPYLSLDVLKIGLANALPSLGVRPDGASIAVATVLWPLVRAMAINTLETDLPYTIEGELLPMHVAELQQQFPFQISACFLVYTTITPEAKLRAIRSFGGHPNDWTSAYGDEEVLALCQQMIGFSCYLAEECQRLGLLYIDTSRDFTGALEGAFASLAGATEGQRSGEPFYGAEE